ncbi:maleylacetate reductase [Lichenifustis flavocetrariae]|uniref:Maleylacetate reductase n=1 Tax=Lichenifustis flavocetrariae TaxID=2949735 RepID=A0AA41YXY9_9HYPH|nr:maleylacetate reductase [Lichenifustis flavocetrariae]MCW6509262.1 maleylacetate reductase [Lichenifustis flavocetrariae]
MMEAFVYNAHPARVIFGSGTLRQLPTEVERLGLRRVLVLSTPQQEKDGRATAEAIGGRAAAVFAGATMHTPVEVTEKAMALVLAERIDGIVAVGGGSTTGLAKAVALRTDLPQIVAPTTYAGSEMTPILGETRDGVKTTQKSPKILPEVVIYDVDLTLSLPVALSSVSGMNAIAHAVEALYAQDRNPIISLMAVEGIRALAQALPKIAEAPADRKARSDALYGAWLCGTCLGAVGMALHHKLCHTLGGSFDLPHAETHTAVLPHATAYNAPAAPEAMRAIAGALGTGDAARGLYDLAHRLGATLALKTLGMTEHGIETAADLAMANPYWNPRPLERNAIRDLLARAYAGEPPRA